MRICSTFEREGHFELPVIAAASTLSTIRRSFVGRQRELDQIERAFGGGARLVTVTGPAGTGKTRLAERFVELVERDGSREALWFCELAQVESSSDLCATVGSALGLPFGGRDVEESAEAIARALARRGRALVVLDNVEHLVEQTVPLLSLWQDEAPDVEFLVTSQERLRLAEEQCIPLGPLPFPSAAEQAAERLLAFDAVRLFVERARAADPSFAVDEAEAAQRIAAIVRSLDGIPLAIELAAARVGMLGLGELNRLLERRFEVLVAESAGVAKRHATLRGAIDWSWNLLSPTVQSALAQCAVFRGGFSLEAFERVVEPPAGAEPSIWALDTLQTLHDKSFVTATSPEGFVGERRYALYESIRAYARDKLVASGIVGAAERRHADYYLSVAESWRRELDGPRGAELRGRLRLERENLLAIHERGMAHGSRPGVDRAVRAVLPLEVVFAMNGPFDRYVGLLDSALASARAAALAPAQSAEAYLSRGRMHIVQGRFAEALHDFQQALEFAERAGAARLVALAALKAGQAAAIEGRSAEAEEHFERAAAFLATADDHSLERQYCADLSLVRAQQGRTLEALELSERTLALARKLGNRREEGAALGNAGARLNELRRIDAARDHYERSIEILTEVGDRRAAAVFDAHLANMDLERGDTAGARRRLVRSLAVQRNVGDWAWEGLILGFLGHVALLDGQPREAASAYRDASAILPGSYRRWAALFLGAQAVAEARLGQRETSAEHLASALRTSIAVGAPMDRVALELYASLVRLIEARRGGDAEAAEEGTRELAARVRADDAEHPVPDEVRFALLLLDRELAGSETELRSAPARPTLAVAADGGWFDWEPAGRVDVSRRAALKRMLAELVSARERQPGRGIALDRLFEAAWPGAKIRPESRAARVYVSVGTLRKLGLGNVLLRQDDGYLLDPAVPVAVSAG